MDFELFSYEHIFIIIKTIRLLMTSRIVPSDSFNRFLLTPASKSAHDHIKNILTDFKNIQVYGGVRFAEGYAGTDARVNYNSIKISRENREYYGHSLKTEVA